VTHRAAAHWFGAGQATTADHRAVMEKLVSPPRLRPETKKFALYTLPACDGVAASAVG
jgi:hypothetical protein